MPLIGAPAVSFWESITDMGVAELAPRLTPYAGTVTKWFVSSMGSIGSMLVQFLLTVAIAAVLFSNGEYAARTALRFGRRLGGTRGEAAVRLAGGAVRGVALGVVVTALAQSALGGLGLAVVGVPFAALADRADVHPLPGTGRPGAGAAAGRCVAVLVGRYVRAAL